MGRHLVVGIVATLPLALVACGQCLELPGCSAERFSYTGQLVDRVTGKTVTHATISFVRDSGAPMAPDSIAAPTDAEGFFHLSAPSNPGGAYVWGTLVVQPPAPFQRYAVPAVPFTVRSVRGDGELLGRVVVQPYIYFIGEVQNASGTVVPSANVSFHRTSGVRLISDNISMTADPTGFFALQPQPAPGEYGWLAGDVTISPPGGDTAYTYSIKMPTRFQDVLVKDYSIFTLGGGVVPGLDRARP